VSYTSAEGRRQIVDALVAAAHDADGALADLSEAYELLDELTAERLERDLFRPLQQAAGLVRRTLEQFALRHDLATPARAAAAASAHGRNPNAWVEAAAAAAARADLRLGALQDTMLPVEVGDPELRSGIERVRVLLGGISPRARELTRTVGR